MQLQDINGAMQSILLHHTRGYNLWLGFTTPDHKIALLDEKWALELGTREPAWKRHARKSKSAPNAVAIAGRVFSLPSMAEVVLMATENARHVGHNGPYHAFLRQQWRDDLPRFSYFEMVHQPAEATGKIVWTWRIRKPELGKIEKYLIHLCDLRDIASLRRETNSLVRTYPMYNGIRSQLRRLLRHVQRKCRVCKISYPGPDPENLPAMIGFPGTKSRGGSRLPELPLPTIAKTPELHDAGMA